VDVTAAVTHSLIDVYQHIVTRDEYNNIRVNFHFDYSDETISISSNRNNTAKLTVKTRAEQDLFIRIPGWAPEESVVIHVNGKSAPLKRHGAFAFVPGAPGESTVELGYGLPEHSASERSRCQYFHWPERIRAGADKPFEYTLAWRGDEVVGASPVRPFFPFYPELPGSSRCT
jgi:hypothetical protein